MRTFLALAALVAVAFIAFVELPGRVAAQGDGPTASAGQGLAAADRTVLHAEIRAYLLGNPQILREMIALLEEESQAQTETDDRALVAQNAGAIFEDGFSYVGGNPEGGFTVVEFLDYQCGYCRRAHPEVMELLAADGDIRWIVKELPILGPGSTLAARAATATLISEGPEAYGRLVDVLMRTQGQIDDAVIDEALAEVGADPAAIRTAMADPEVDRRLSETRALADTLRISGTPTFILEDLMVRGYVPRPQMEGAIARLRAEG